MIEGQWHKLQIEKTRSQQQDIWYRMPMQTVLAVNVESQKKSYSKQFKSPSASESTGIAGKDGIDAPVSKT